MAYVGLTRVVGYLSAPSEIRGLNWVRLCHASVVVLHQLEGIKVPLNVGGLHEEFIPNECGWPAIGC